MNRPLSVKSNHALPCWRGFFLGRFAGFWLFHVLLACGLLMLGTTLDRPIDSRVNRFLRDALLHGFLDGFFNRLNCFLFGLFLSHYEFPRSFWKLPRSVSRQT